MVSNLPADAATGARNPDALPDHSALEIKVVINGSVTFVFLPDVIGRRRDHELNPTVGNLL